MEKTKTGEDCANQCPWAPSLILEAVMEVHGLLFAFCYVNGKARKYKNRGLYSFQFDFVEPNVVSHNKLQTRPSALAQVAHQVRINLGSLEDLSNLPGCRARHASRDHMLAMASVGIYEFRCHVILLMHVLLCILGESGTI